MYNQIPAAERPTPAAMQSSSYQELMAPVFDRHFGTPDPKDEASLSKISEASADADLAILRARQRVAPQNRSDIAA